MASQESESKSGGIGAGAGAEEARSTQSNQYDEIGTKYNSIHELPTVQPERPSVVAALGDVRGKRCLDLACGTGRYTALLSFLGASSVHGYDISSTMIDGAKAAYPSPSYPTLHFAVADCSRPDQIKHDKPFDLIFAGWFLNYAGTEHELTAMLTVISQNLNPSGRFVGITTNVNDPIMDQPKLDFYGLDILVLDPKYVAPDTGKEVGITARIRAREEPIFQFDVFQFRKEVYERCAEKAGLRLKWTDPIVPDDERKTTNYWDRWLERPTFVIIEATRV